MVRSKITKLIEESIKGLQKEKKFPLFDIPEVTIESPAESEHGDYATNIAFELSKIVKKEPVFTAKLLAKKLNAGPRKVIERVEVVEPGFVNLFLSKGYLQSQVAKILEAGEGFGNLEIGKNKRAQVEFISANPTGPLTVGNARGGPFGDVLANVFQRAGFKVERAYYINDYGMQILTLGHSVLKDEEAKYKGDYIDYLHKKIQEKDPYKAGQTAAKIIVEEMIKQTAKDLGIEYDEWSSETSLHNSGAVDEALDYLKNKGLLYQKEDAWWFRSSKFGDERDRVVIKADGWKTYLAGDIAYHRYKFEEKKFDKVINIWGADHYGDVPSLAAAVEALGHKDKLDIVLLQFVTLLERGEKLKMSKRKGVYVTMDELLDMVGGDVVRFFFLQKSANTHLNFDLSLAKEQSEKNPVFYVQYAHARICSILKKATSDKQQITGNELRGFCDWSLLSHPSELVLIKQLTKFPELIEDIARGYQIKESIKDYPVQRLPQYAQGLATLFHRFYRDCQVLTDDKKLKEARLGLILATKIVLKNTLDLMGISAPERM